MKDKEFQSSLDLTNDELEEYVPELFKGLWELGSMPGYIIDLIERNDLRKCKNIIDLGCGKGAVLVNLARRFDIQAIGIDIVPEFIEEAKKYASEYGVSDKITFKIEDINDTLKKDFMQDILIYGYDSEVIGDLKSTLERLINNIKPYGYLLLEFMFARQLTKGMASEDDMKNIFEHSGIVVLDRIDWNSDKLKQINDRNTEVIEENIKRLIFQNPDKKEIFNEFLQNQIDECDEMENDYTCTTLLLTQKMETK